MRINPPQLAPQREPAPAAEGTSALITPNVTAAQPPGRQSQAQDRKPDEIPAKELSQVVEQMNKAVQAFNHQLQFEVVRPNRIIIRVIDTDSGEVLQEIPPEKLVEAFSRMEDTLGILLDKKA